MLCAGFCGCAPPGQSQMDDEKEPHFIEGKRAVNSMDYTGAIEEFEKAVEANPRNASAHFELGWLYEEKEPDPAAAIYHYQQFLKLRPNADTAEAVKQRIMNCKEDLAKAVLPLPSAPGVQHDMEQLIQENKQLKEEVAKWQAWYNFQQTNRAPAQTSQGSTQPTQTAQVAQTVQSAQTQQVSHPQQANHPVAAVPNPQPRAPSRTGGRTYIVQPRETLASISRKFNVKLEALTAANPGIDPRRLRAGQAVNIP